MAAKSIRWSDEKHYDWVREHGPKLGWQSTALWALFCEQFRDVNPSLAAFRGFSARVKEGAQPNPVTDLAPVVPATIEEATRQQAAEMERRREKRMLADLLSKQSAITQVVDAVREVVPTIPRIEVPRLQAPDIDPLHSTPQTALLLLSDVHIGQVVRPEEVDGLGEYNFNKFLERRDRLVKTVRSIVQHHRMSHPVDDLAIAWLGDMVEGDGIFPSQRLNLDKNLMEQVFDGAFELSTIPLAMLDLVDRIQNYCVVGNHGRVGRKGDNLTYVSWDYVTYRTMQLKLAEFSDRITWDIPESFFTTPTIAGHPWLFWHGDDLKSWNGLPWYGLQRAVGAWTSIFNTRQQTFENAAIGHFHQHAEIQQYAGNIIANGCWPGSNEYSLRLRSISRPMQTLLFLHPKYGVTARYNVLLDIPS